MRLGVQMQHGPPYDARTQGNDERFNQTLKVEAIGNQVFSDVRACQQCFDTWRTVYNFERPHEALGLAVPASRYQMSVRSFPEQLPTVEYGAHDDVRIVQRHGKIYYKNREIKVGKGFCGQRVAVRPTTTDGVHEVFFCQTKVATFDLRAYTTP